MKEDQSPEQSAEEPTPESGNNDRPSSRRRRGRRGRSAADNLDYSVPSPCIAICEFNDQGLCKGCLRSGDEIRDWIIMSREQKLEVLDLIAERRLASRS